MNMKKNEAIQNPLDAAINWGLRDDSAPWKRALETVSMQQDRYSVSELNKAKENLRNRASELLSDWYSNILKLGLPVDEISKYEDDPEGLWKELASISTGIFEKGPDPLQGFLLSITSLKPHDVPFYLSPRLDGWGVIESK